MTRLVIGFLIGFGVAAICAIGYALYVAWKWWQST